MRVPSVVFSTCLIVYSLAALNDPSDKEHDNHAQSVTQHDIDETKLYIELFKQKRKDHMSAISSIQSIDHMKQRPFIEEIISNIRNILIESRQNLERTAYTHVTRKLPDTDTLKEHLSKVLENTAFFSDLTLRFPKLVLPRMKDQKLRTVLTWAFHLTKDSGLLDETTEKIVNMMGQETKMIPMEEGYENPYWNMDELVEKEAAEELKRLTAEKKEKKRKHDAKIKKGPSMSKSEL